MFIGALRILLAADLVIGHAQRRKNGPVGGLQLYGAGQEVHRVLGAAHRGKGLAIFADHARIVGRHHHKLRQILDRFGIIAGQAQRKCLLDAGFQIGAGRGIETTGVGADG